jgi:adenylate cyclase
MGLRVSSRAAEDDAEAQSLSVSARAVCPNLATLGRFASALVGDARHHRLEQRLFSAVTLLSGTANVAGAFGLLGLREHSLLVVLNVGTGLLFLLFYWLSRFRGRSESLYWPFVSTIALFLFANSLANAGSGGGAFFYFIPGAVIATILAGRLRTAALAGLMFASAPIAVLYVEWERPDLVASYAGPHERLVDVTGSFLFVELFTVALVVVLAKSLNLERARSEALLLNVLPASVAEELKLDGRVRPRHYDSATILFTDFVGFTSVAERMAPEELVAELDTCFRAFDAIARRHGLEKIKTIGDAYMAAGGIPEPSRTHAVDCVLAALEIRSFIRDLGARRRAAGLPFWELRIGIHSGGLVAGVIGSEKFSYDVWGDTVNTASRLESSGLPGEINVSAATLELVGGRFAWRPRGQVEAKGKGPIPMFLIEGLLPE